ncbi:MAG: flagellin [Oscillospiraceae bacterium]|nr:flagellin [Oscillospiraceae bacterium]
MVVQHNIMALNAYNRLSANNASVSKNLEKLSSGYRINRAGDDAAGLAISEKMRAQITGLERSSDNAQDGISLVQTAEGALTEVHSMLNRMVELATQSANGTYDNSTDRTNLQSELDALKSEVDRIASETNFNGIKLLDGSMGGGTSGAEVTNGGKTFILQAPEGVTIKFAAGAATTTAGSTDVKAAWSGTSVTLTIGADAIVSDEALAKALNDASGAPDSAKGTTITIKGGTVGGVGGTASTADATGATSAAAKYASVASGSVNNTDGKSTKVTFDSTVAGNRTSVITVATGAGVEGATRDASTGAIALNLTGTKNYTAADLNSMLAKAGAELTATFDGEITGTALAGLTYGTGGALAGGAGLANGGGLNLQIGDTASQRISVKVDNMSSSSLGLDAVNIGSENSAVNSIQTIKDAINTVSSTRSDLGAIQNRLEYTVNNLATTTENLTSAESRIRDTDMAKEMMAYTKNNVLSQAAQAMLAQANQQPQSVLQLLQ